MNTAYSFIQIGAHTGEEALEFARDGGRCLLVEPVPSLNARLQERYGTFSNVEIVSYVISDTPGEVLFYSLEDISDLPWWADQIGSLDEDHLTTLGRTAGFPAGFERKIVSTPMEALTPTQLFERHGVASIDFLFVDTEGFDVPILMATDLETHHIRNIVFERKHTDGVRRTGYKYNRLVARLKELGYTLEHLDDQNDWAALKPGYSGIRETRDESLKRFRDWATSVPSAIPDTKTARGVIYLGLGPECFRQALDSAATLRHTNPSLPATIFTDQTGDSPHAELIQLPADKSPFKLKVEAMQASPYESTLFLDADTFVLGSLDDLFQDVEANDLCICHGPAFRYDDGAFFFEEYEAPDTLNTGVIGFSRNETVDRLFTAWAASMEEQPDDAITAGTFCDQWYFNNRLTHTDLFQSLRFSAPDNVRWNLRSYALGQAIADGRDADAVIVHAKPWETMQFWGVDLYQYALSSINRGQQSCLTQKNIP